MLSVILSQSFDHTSPTYPLYERYDEDHSLATSKLSFHFDEDEQ